jgi:two-component system NarL family sensor kinase
VRAATSSASSSPPRRRSGAVWPATCTTTPSRRSRPPVCTCPSSTSSSAASAGRPPPPSARPSTTSARTWSRGLAAVRTFLFNLRPPLLDSAGLEPALRQQLDKLAERAGCKTGITWLLDERLDRDFETVAFRVVQEALANVAKHADASTVRVWGEREGSMVVVAVADDGVGFDPEVAGERAAATGHLGLRSMAERIHTAAGGRLEITSQPSQGTQVVLRLPEWA